MTTQRFSAALRLIQDLGPEDYADYETYTPDVNGFGCKVTVSICHGEKSAYVTLLIDDVNGKEYLYTTQDIDYDTACKMTFGVT